MPKYHVTFNVLGAFTLAVDADDEDAAYDEATETFFRVLDGGNVEYQIESRNLEIVEPGELTDSDRRNAELDRIIAEGNEDDCRDALEEAGWVRRSLGGPERFVRESDGRISHALTWAALSAELLAEV